MCIHPVIWIPSTKFYNNQSSYLFIILTDKQINKTENGTDPTHHQLVPLPISSYLCWWCTHILPPPFSSFRLWHEQSSWGRVPCGASRLDGLQTRNNKLFLFFTWFLKWKKKKWYWCASLCLQRVLRSHVKEKISEMVCMDLSITRPHLERIPSPSPGADSISPAGTHTHILLQLIHTTYATVELHRQVIATDHSLLHLVPLRSRLVLRPASRRWGPGVQDWRVALLENLLTLWWRLLETTSVHWVSKAGKWQRWDTVKDSWMYVFLLCVFF